MSATGSAVPLTPRPPVQRRSLTSHRQMVEGALRLLDERDIDQISIRDIVDKVSCTRRAMPKSITFARPA